MRGHRKDIPGRCKYGLECGFARIYLIPHGRLLSAAMTEKRSPGEGRVPELDGLRAIAILSVFLFHALDTPLLWMGVDVFFVLSGFLITGILLREKGRPGYFGHFYERRARRILPPLALFLVAVSLLFGTQWLRHWYWYVLFSANIAQSLHKIDHESLGVLWSLAVEEQFYLIWPVLIFLLSPRAIMWTAASLLVVAPALRAAATPFVSDFAPIYHLTPFRFDLLAAGALLACIARREPAVFRISAKWASIGAIASACLLLFLSRFPWFRVSSNSVVANACLYTLTLVIAAAALILALSQRGPVAYVLRWRVLRYIGLISYSMYLIHFALILWLRNYFGNRWVVLVLSLAGTILYSALSWHLLERRLLSRKTAATKPLVLATAQTS